MLPAPRLLGAVITFLSLLGTAADVARAVEIDPAVVDACPGYNTANVKLDVPRLLAKLVLAAKPCNVFGNDIRVLDRDWYVGSLAPGIINDVTSDGCSHAHYPETRIHLKITNASSTGYEVPKSAFPRPAVDPGVRLDVA